MAQEFLDGAYVHPGVQKMRGKAVAKRMHSVAFFYFFMLFILKGFSKKELKTIIKVIGLERLSKILHLD